MKKILALILAILMLCSVVSVAAFAEDAPAGDAPAGDTPAGDTPAGEEAVDWEKLYAKHGINIYIGAPTDTPPVVDGTISAGEYTHEKVTPFENIDNPNNIAEIQSELKTFYAHDTDYIYMGAIFEQKNDNRAYWLQWKPFNSFDVFNGDADVSTYYYQRVATQLRYLEDGTVTTKNEGNPKGNFQWTPRAFDKAVPTWGLMSDGDTEYNYAGSKIVDEAASKYTKTYEVRIAKSYIAKIAGCEVADVRVMPFIISFHANITFGAPLSQDLAVEIFENKLDAYVTSDTNTWWFLVCGEAPEGYEESIGIPYTPPVEDGGDTPTDDAPAATTTEATTTEATTTAAPTTAAATTAAATEEEKGGCGSSLTVSALAILPTIAGGALLLKRRKED